MVVVGEAERERLETAEEALGAVDGLAGDVDAGSAVRVDEAMAAAAEHDPVAGLSVEVVEGECGSGVAAELTAAAGAPADAVALAVGEALEALAHRVD